jgi:thymidylate synthase
VTTQYLQLLQRIKDEGVFKGDRTGTGTQSLFGAQSRYDLTKGFPLLTTKKMFTRGVFEELLWILRGSTDVNELREKNVRIWDEWADDDGNLGPVYGAQWRHWNLYMIQHDCDLWELQRGRDQIAELIDGLKNNPDSRRHMVTAWNPDEVDAQALPPCHCLFQCWTRELTMGEREKLRGDDAKVVKPELSAERTQAVYDREGIPRRGLSLQLYQRSCDVFLGVPFNIASYALLTHMLAQVCDMIALDFVHTYGDVHIYNNHREQVDLQLTREPKPLPRLRLNPDVKDIDGFTIDDIEVVGYEHDAVIKAPVSV